MGSFRVFVALTWMVTVTIIFSKAAPVTEFFGPPRTSIEGDSHVEQQPEEHEQKKVEEMERFHRTYKNGTVEFKMALSNGHVQYQRISSKIVDGDKVQVYEGYISEQYKDGRYGTRYYAADENGYRSSAVIIEDEPPKLPTSGPYSSSLSQDVQKALSPMNEDNTYMKPKTLKDNLVEIENDLEEEQLINLNLGSTTESLEILKQSEEQSSVIPSTTEFLELLSTTKLSNNYKEPEPTPLSEEGSGNDVAAEKPLNEDLSGSNTLPVNTSEDGEGENLNSEVRTEQSIEEIPEGTTGSLLNDEVTPTELPTQVNNEEPSTSVVPEVTEIKTDGATSSVSRYPLEDAESQSTTLSSVEATEVQTEQSSSEISEDNSTGIPTSSIASTTSNNDENTSEESVTSIEDIKLNTEKSFEGVSEATTEISSNDAITSTDAPTTISSEAHVEPSTSAISELNDIKTETESSSVSEDAGSESTTLTPNDDVSKSSDEITQPLTEQTSSGEIASTETVTSSDLSTTESSSIETTTHLSIESSTNTEHEASVDEISNDQGSLANENNARSLDILKVLPLSEKNTTSEIEETKNISDNSNSSDVNEETTNTNTEQSTEEDSISSTASSNEKINSDITTEAGILLTTSENGLETDSSTENDSQITTNQPLPSSSEENHEKSSEDETTTKLPEDSSEENQSTTSSTNLNNNSSNTEEKEGKSIEESSEENQSTPSVTEQNTEIPSTTTVEPKSNEHETSTELPEESSEEGHSTKSVTSSSNEEKDETSTADETSNTDHPQESSEEEHNTEAEVISTTEEISRGVEIEFAPPVIHF